MNFKVLRKYFPLPKFLEPPHIGVSISDTSIKAIRFDKKFSDANFKSAIVSLDKGIVKNGVISDQKKLIERLSLIRKNFDQPFVFFTVPDELTYIFSAEVSFVGKDMTEAVAFLIEENVPLTLNEVIFDFEPVRVDQSDSDTKVSVVVVACVKKEVDKFVEIFHKSGFEPVGCIHESQAVAKSVIPSDYSGVCSIVHAREERIGIHLVKDGIVCFSTIRNISSDDYEKEFLDEYERYVDYCLKYNTDQNQPIKTVFVCGEFKNTQKIIESSNTKGDLLKKIKLSNVWINVFDIHKHLPEIPFEKSLSFAGSIGAALSAIN